MRHRCFICDDAGWFTHEGVTYGCDCEPGVRFRLNLLTSAHDPYATGSENSSSPRFADSTPTRMPDMAPSHSVPKHTPMSHLNMSPSYMEVANG